MTTRATGPVHPAADFHTHRPATAPPTKQTAGDALPQSLQTSQSPRPSPPDDRQQPVRRRGRRGTFAALEVRNFRLFVAGLFVSATGGWVQRIAQDWLVLTLTGSATAVGITTALQFLPTLLLGLFGGVIADRFPKRRTLLVTQSTMAALAAVLAVLALAGSVLVWHVYALALLLGLATAVDNPTRQSFVSEMVGQDRVRNAISLVSSTFQLGGLIGPAVGGAMIGAVGTGRAFALNAVSFLGSITALLLMREHELPPPSAARRAARGMPIWAGLRTGLKYTVHEPAVRWAVVLVGIFGMFTISLPVTLTAFADVVFETGAAGYGLLNSVVAVGSLVGALLSARRVHAARLRTLFGIAAILAITEMVAAMAPTLWAFVPLLAALGIATLTFLTMAQSMVQLTTPDALRGRVAGVYNLVFIGGGAIGGPLVGWIAEEYGARTALLLAGLVPALATVVIALKLARSGRLRVVVQRAPVRRSPWRQPPLRVQLQEIPLRVAQPAASRSFLPGVLSLTPAKRNRRGSTRPRPKRSRRSLHR